MVKRILAVDDSASVRQVERFVLSGAGYEVTEARDGQEALTLLATMQANLVLTDLNMPKIDGLELIRAVRKSPAHRLTPIIMVTTESDSTKKAEGKAAGATGWIVQAVLPGAAPCRRKEGARMSSPDSTRSLQQFICGFRDEATELLRDLEETLLELETRPNDGELVARIFRALHTIKGTSAMFSLDNIASVAHGLETAFDEVRHGRLAASPQLVSLALAGKDFDSWDAGW